MTEEVTVWVSEWAGNQMLKLDNKSYQVNKLSTVSILVIISKWMVSILNWINE